MTKTVMLDIEARPPKGVGLMKSYVTSHKRDPRLKISKVETKRVKGNINIIINSELSHRN